VPKIKPSDEHPVPFDIDDEKPQSFVEALETAASTAEVMDILGAPLEVDPTTFEREKALIDAVVKDKQTAPLTNFSTALAATHFIKEYGKLLAFDAMEVRAALTNKLLEIANCGEPKHELRALELLGKHSDISLFTQRSEININYSNPEALEKAIKERVKRLLNADTIDAAPLGIDLDEELGRYERKPEEGEDE
jgi:hypothetical protein